MGKEEEDKRQKKEEEEGEKKKREKCAYIFRIKQLENNKNYIHMESRR